MLINLHETDYPNCQVAKLTIQQFLGILKKRKKFEIDPQENVSVFFDVEAAELEETFRKIHTY